MLDRTYHIPPHLHPKIPEKHPHPSKNFTHSLTIKYYNLPEHTPHKHQTHQPYAIHSSIYRT